MPFEVGRSLIDRHFRKRADFAWSEEFFLRAIASARSKHDVYCSVLGLREVGTPRSIPVLKTLLSYPMSDVKSCAILTIAQIARVAETEYYAQTLLNPKYREKCYAMWAIEVAADERAIPAVIEYLKKNMRIIRKTISNPKSLHRETVLHAGRYLLQFAGRNEQAREMLDDLAAVSDQVAGICLDRTPARVVPFEKHER